MDKVKEQMAAAQALINGNKDAYKSREFRILVHQQNALNAFFNQYQTDDQAEPAPAPAPAVAQ